ncbi:MAG: LOG family protein [Candidatus Sungbacteria bacterium]|uniref:LOG family protein n=1 Tax=Candidatus Sungiibacteriota bacterium TaxID=2750080 RepID=A0A932YXN6_9BACT|nr:LOG family protein [Candidatus Sungbacteria bacterium]
MKPSPHTHLKYKIAISGAAETGHCGPNALPLTKELGAEIARQGAVLLTGATTGAPYWAAIGAKDAGGFVIGLSPAASEVEHVKKYRLPLDYHDMIVYTGFGYSGRNLFLTRSADGVIISCGRMGTLNEFTIAFEDQKPIGVLTGSGWMTDDIIKKIIAEAHRGNGKVIWDNDPKRLVAKMIQLIRKEKLVKI